jgi:arachidonate 15-lipoxygenase
METSTPSLPQHDLHPGRRYRQIGKALDTYHYQNLEGTRIALLKHLPREQRFDASYRWKRIGTAAKFMANLAVIRAIQAQKPLTNVEGYQRYFPLVEKPKVMRTFQFDSTFGYQRLGGPNPMDLTLLDAPPLDFDFDDARLSHVLGRATSLREELANRRLFYADYSRFFPIVDAVDRRCGDRFFAAPKVLFYWQPDPGGGWEAMTPVAIQLRPLPGANNPVFTPEDGVDWLMAKMFAQIADTMSHELEHHLGRTHLILEPVIIAMHRRLAENHPVHILLSKHFEDTLAINDFGRQTLINPGGFLDQLMAPWLWETLSIVENANKDFFFDKMVPRRDLANRGLLDTTHIRDFPYRDDGLALWDAIHAMVTDYLQLYYSRGDRDVVMDLELQRFSDEMRERGRLRGLPKDLTTRAELIELVTQLIWIAGPQHAAVNYTQWDYVAFIPNMPFSGYAKAPTSKGKYRREADIMGILPNHRQTVKQVLLMAALTGWRHSRLGDYAPDAFADPRALDIVRAFRERLRSIENEIDARNLDRRVPYVYLKPSLVPTRGAFSDGNSRV